MKQTRSRILSLLLALILCLSLLPGTALAADDVISISQKKLDLKPSLGQPSETAIITVSFQNEISNDENNIKNNLTVSSHLTDIPVTINHVTNATSGLTNSFDVYLQFDTSKVCNTAGEYTGDVQIHFSAELMGFIYKTETSETWDVTIPVTIQIKENIAKDYSMMFFPNGGTITEIGGYSRERLLNDPVHLDEYGIGIEHTTKAGMMFADANGKLPCFPTVKRDGYTFDGWYIVPESIIPESHYMNAEPEFMTNFGSYQKASLSTAYTGNYCFVAKWTVADKVREVWFHPNGGTAEKPKGYAYYDKEWEGVDYVEALTDANCKLPVLPTATREGYTFDGWYTARTGGTKVSANMDLSAYQGNGGKNWADDQIVLWAHWTEGNNILKGLTYNFGNSHKAFGYSDDYRIPLSCYQMVFGKTARAKQLYDWAGVWGGSCYAMAATSGMFFQDGDVPESSFRSGAEVPYDLAVSDKNIEMDMRLKEYIEAVFVSQYANTIQADYGTGANLNTLCAAVKSFRQTGKNAPLIAIWGAEGGHAVLGYDVVDVSSKEARLMIYDPNFPNKERYITLGKSGGNYTSWAYMMNDLYNWGTGRSGNKINYVPYSDYLQAWANRAKKTASSAAMLSTDVQNISITNSAGTVVATVKNGELTTKNANIYPIRTIGLTSDGSESSFTGTLLSLPVGEYTVTNTGTDKSFEISMVDVDQSATVTTSASSVTFLVDDSETTNSVRVNGTGERYDITLYSTLDRGYGEVVLTGTTSAGTTAVAQISGRLYGTNLDTNGTIKADGKYADSSILSGTVPGTSVKTNPFTDVSPNAYYYDAVLWAVEKGVTSGTGDGTTFSPGNPCTRAQFATFLWRAAGSPSPAGIANKFTDVSETEHASYYNAILWGVERGIIMGTGDTTFSPNTTITRAQAVTLMYRYAQKAGIATRTGGTSFDDVPNAGNMAAYYDAVIWAVANGITNGNSTTANTFGPMTACDRGMMITFLYRLFNTTA